LIAKEAFALPAEYNLRQPIAMTVSIGVASCSDRLDEATALFQAADSCLYRAKRLGRNRVVINDSRPTKKILDRQQVISAA